MRKAIEEKAKKVEEIKEKVKKYPVLALIDLRNLPDSLLQSVRKKLREAGSEVIVAKKAVITRVFDSIEKLKEKKSEIDKPVGIILTEMTPFELNKIFRKNKKKLAAKAGQIAPYEIVVPAGDTDIPPGPALSELKAAGIAVQIKGGKIVVSKDSVVAKEGEEITEMKAKALQKLGILPFEAKINMIFAYDGKYIYAADLLDIDEEYAKNAILEAFSQAFNLSMNAKIPSSANIEMLLAEAVQQGKNVALNGKLYSSEVIEELLASAVREAMALSSLEGGKKE